MPERRTKPDRRLRRAFTLLELLVVMAIITILLGLVGLSASVLQSPARRAAVNQLVAAIEQTRVAALANGEKAYIGFADKEFPIEEMRYRAYVIFRDRSSADPPGTPEFVTLGEWRLLPRRMALSSTGTSILTSPEKKTFDGILPPGPDSTLAPLQYISFSPYGAIQDIHDKRYLRLQLYPGFYGGGQDNYAQSENIFIDIITISKFTGRPQVDMAKAQ